MKRLLFLLTMLVLSVNVQASDADDYEAGKEIFEFRCADTCHQIPAAQSLKPKQWRIVLNTMQKRMERAGMSRLTEQELDQLLHYLTSER